MIRRFNYTHRRRIPKTSAIIRLRRVGEATEFDADLRLEESNLPGSARVFVEAYFKGTLMRFDFGTVGALLPPEPRHLARLPQPELAFFRLKVVDAQRGGLVLAGCDRILPELTKGGAANRRSIFTVELMAMEAEVWRLRFDEQHGPILELNVNFKETARNDPAFAALVYPDLIRRVLRRVLKRHDDALTEDSWEARWLRFGGQLAGERNPVRDDEEAVENWIDKVVVRFVGRGKLLINYRKTLRLEEAP